MKSYVAVVRRIGLEFAIWFPDVPGCASCGATIEEAREGAARDLAVHLQGLVEQGDVIPSASSLKEIVADPQWRDGGIDSIILAVRPGR